MRLFTIINSIFSELFKRRKINSRGHVEFINAALRHIKEFGLHKDLETYKALLNVFPKGPFIATNNFQRIFVHYPVQQTCCVRVLDEMDWNGVQPDKEVHDIVVNAFGNWSFASKKIKRMLYWMPKLKYSNKYIDRREIENHEHTMVDLAYLVLKMICRDPGTVFSHIKDVDEGEKNNDWIVSGQSPLQQHLIGQMKPKTTIYIDGPSFVYLMNKKMYYICLTGKPDREKVFDNFVDEDEDSEKFDNWTSPMENGVFQSNETNIHQQKDETILALAVFGKIDRRWAAAWINHLMELNPSLSSLRVLIRLREENSGIATTPPPEIKKNDSFQ
uniref:Evolutionarily conserved signaling intermediate in Toll pathway, mitochondrial n=1 Tax=Syphacia muris TaxID=451379 RepID=A0A158R3U7_9BILA